MISAQLKKDLSDHMVQSNKALKLMLYMDKYYPCHNRSWVDKMHKEKEGSETPLGSKDMLKKHHH